MSASRMPTDRPWRCIATARLAATVDLPTPPLPAATAMTWRAARCSACAGLACACAFESALAARSSVVISRTRRTSGSAVSAASIAAFSRAIASGSWPDTRSTTVATPSLSVAPSIRPAATSPCPVAGSRRASRLALSVFDMKLGPQIEMPIT